MFIRKKKNRSGTTSIVVVDKHGKKFKELHTVGVAADNDEKEKLCVQGREWINRQLGILEFDFGESNRKSKEIESAAVNMSVICSLLATCKAHDVNLRDCLNDIIARMPYHKNAAHEELIKFHKTIATATIGFIVTVAIVV